MKSFPREILKILTDGQFHSGEELGQKFNITRSAVWKIIKQLCTLDIEIISVKAKGYQIPNGLELFNKTFITKNLTKTSKEKIANLEIFESINSTNQYLLDKAKNGGKSGSICLAEHQTAGRGRRGRQWHSPFGSNLYCSLLWHFPRDPAEISGLSLAIAIAIIRTLKKFEIENLQLKWPNDILWQEKKLGGVLLEMIAENHESSKIVIGIGLNLQMPSTAHIDQPWTDLYTIAGKRIAKNLLTATLLNETISVLTQFENEGLSPFLSEWQQHDVSKNREITLLAPTAIKKGIATGISEKGELLFLENNTQQLQKVLSGEVSLRINL